MSEAQELLDAGLRAHEDVLGNPTVVYRGLHYPCTYGSLRRGEELGFGGKSETIQMSCSRRTSARAVKTADAAEITVDSDEIGAANDVIPFQVGKLVTARNKQMRILDVTTDSTGAIETAFLGPVR